MKLSDLKPEDYTLEQPSEVKSSLKLSELEQGSYEPVLERAPASIAKEETKSPSILKTFLEQAAQAPTLGHIPEATGLATKAVVKARDALAGTKLGDLLNIANVKLEPQVGSYTDIRDVTAKELEEGVETNPKAALAGTIGGALLSAPLTLGGGAAAASAKTLSAGQKIAQAGKVGALLGALQNPGRTEGQIDPLQLKERALGGAIGGVLAGGLTTLGQSLKGGGKLLVDKLKQSPRSRDIVEAFEIAKKTGERITGSTDELKQFGKDINTISESLSNLTSGRGSVLHKRLINEFDDIYKQAQQQGFTVDLTNKLQNIRNQVADISDDLIKDPKEKQRLLSLIDNKLQGVETKVLESTKELVPATNRQTVIGDEQQFLDSLEKIKAKKVVEGVTPEDITSKISQIESPTGQPIKLGQIIQNVRDKEGNLSSQKVLFQKELAQVDQPEFLEKIGQTSVLKRQQPTAVAPVPEQEVFRKQVKDIIPSLEKGPVEKAAVQLEREVKEGIDNVITQNNPQLSERLQKANEQLKKLNPDEYGRDKGLSELTPKFSDIVNKDNIQTEAGVQASLKVEKYLNKLSEIDKTKANELRKAIDEAAQKFRISRRVSGGSGQVVMGSSPVQQTILGSVGSQLARVAGVAGKTAHQYEQGIAPMIRKVKSMPFEQLADSVERIAPEKGAELVKALRNSVGRDEAGKRAILFSIFQNPTYREIMNEVTSSVNE